MTTQRNDELVRPGSAEPDGTPLTVLHVDDALSNRRLVRGILERAGWGVLEAATGKEALRLLSERLPDVVLLDVQLPDTDGFELCRRIRADVRTANLPLVHLSGARVEQQDRAGGLDHGADAYLTHPVQPSVLLATLRAVIRARRAEEALRRSEARLRTMLEAMPDAVVLTSRDGRIQILNPAAEKLFGYSRQELAGQPVEVLVPEPLREAHRAHRERFSREPRALALVGGTMLWARRKDGSLVPVEIALGPLPGGEVVAGIRDVRERIRAEETLQRLAQAVTPLTGESFFAGLVAELAAAVGADLTIATRFHDNDRAAMLAVWEDGAPGALEEYDISGTPCAQVVSRGEPCLWVSGVRETFPADRFLVEHRVESLAEVPLIGSGNRVLGSLSAMYREPMQNPDRVVAILRILAARAAAELERLATEEKLRRAEADLRGIFENAVEGIFRATPDGRLLMANPALEEIVGEGLQAARAATPFLDRECWVDLCARVEREGRVVGVECRTRAPGLRWLRVNARGLRAGDGRLVAIEGFVTDVTEQRRLQEQFLHAQKMEALGRLAGGVAHDFNNLLFVIGGYAAVLQKRLETDPAAHKALEEIGKATERAAALTRKLLAFARRQPVDQRPVCVDDLLEGMRDMLGRLLGEDVALEMSLKARPLRVLADPVQIEQAIVNLAVNARDAMPRGGTLAISTRGEPASVATEGSDAVPDRFVVIEVTDTGVGMPPEVRERIFEPFFTTKEKGRGTGLGLSTVYGIVQQAGGRIQVESEEGQGSTFRIVLPAADGRRSGETYTGPGSVVHGDLQGTVLCVEDDSAVRELVCEVLTAAGLNVVPAATGEEAIEKARELRGIDLLLTDVIMPGMSGRELAERLLRDRPGRAWSSFPAIPETCWRREPKSIPPSS